MTGGWSGAIRLGVETQDRQRNLSQKMAFVEGGVGATKRYFNDLDVYALLNAGLGAKNGGGQVYIQPEFGVIVREVADMKTVFSFSHRQTLMGKADKLVQYRLSQSKFLTPQLSLHVRIDGTQSAGVWYRSIEMGVKKIF